MNAASPRVYLLDVEGTVAPIAFVHEQLFPYARAHFPAFLAQNKRPNEAQIKNALAGNLCRCGTHLRIVRAIKRVVATSA